MIPNKNVSFIINPRFSNGELDAIDQFVKAGVAKNRSDFVRKATIIFIEKTGTREQTKGEFV